MRDLFLDFESFYGRVEHPEPLNLSLKNQTLSYTDYVRHPEFEVLGVSVRWEDADDPTFYRSNEIEAFFETVDWSSTRVIAHNANFDGLILYEVYGVVPAEYFCTMACAEAIYQGATPVGLDALAKLFGLGEKSPDLENFRGLHAKDIDEAGWARLEVYANNDCDLLYKLFHTVKEGLPEDEIELMSKTIMLFCDPLMDVDVPMAQEGLDDAIKQRDELVNKTGLTKQKISGNISFENALRSHLGYIPTKLNKKNEVKPAFAKTDLEFVMLKSHPDEAVRNLVNARMEVKSSLGINRAERLVKLGTTGSKKMNVCLNYGRAHTLRWTGGNKMNPQNFTRGSKLRRSLIAPEGHVLCVVDSSQIEARVLAIIAGQDDLVETFRTGGDPYAVMAEDIYGIEIDTANKDYKVIFEVERFMGKTATLGLGFGMWWKKFYNEIKTGARGMALDISMEFAERVVKIYRAKNDKIMAFHKTAESWLWYMLDDTAPLKILLNGLITLDPATNRVIFPNGCYLRYPSLCNDDNNLVYQAWNVKTKRYEFKKIYGGLFVENLVQAIARHIVAAQILAISRKYRCVLFVHDECVYCVPVEIADEALSFGLDQFKVIPEWFPYDIPLDSEGGYDVCYSK